MLGLGVGKLTGGEPCTSLLIYLYECLQGIGEEVFSSLKRFSSGYSQGKKNKKKGGRKKKKKKGEGINPPTKTLKLTDTQLNC